MSAGVAPGDIIIAMGSPGTTLSSTNTIVATPPKVTAAMKRRWAAEFMIHARRADTVIPAKAGIQGRQPTLAAEVWMPAFAGMTNLRVSTLASGFGDQSRLQRPGRVGGDLEARLVDDGLRILDQRNHIALFRDIFVDSLPAG